MAHITQCPSCYKKIEYISSQIGENFTCFNCGYSFKLPIPEEVENPKIYNLPEKIEIHVCNKLGLPIKTENIIISIERGYIAGPFFTNKQGVVEITKKMLEEEEKDWISSGGGDHRNFSLISNLTLCISSKETIDRWIKARESTWNFLLEHEKKYWRSINELISAMKLSKNYSVEPVNSTINLINFKGNEKIIHTIKAEFKLNDYQKMIITFSAIIGIIVALSIANYGNLSIRGLFGGLFIALLIIGALGLFCIYTKIGRKIDRGATKAVYDRLFKKS